MTTIYVTIGKPDSVIPLANKIVAIIYEKESPVKVAKEIRKKYCGDNKPSNLSWAVFWDVRHKFPTLHSKNWNPRTMTDVEILGTVHSKELGY